MSIKNFLSYRPEIAESAFIDPTAVIIGRVSIEADSSIWPGAVIRGDVNVIKIGQRTNIQDGSVMHGTHAGPSHPNGHITMVGNDVTVGHRVTLHGCTIEDRCLIGIGSCVLDGVVIESEVILGAGSLVPPHKRLESGYLWLGSPVRRIRELTAEEKQQFLYSARYYMNLKKQYLTGRP